MLKKRIVPCLDIRDGKVTKGIEFKNNVDLGCPAEMAERYSEGGADEIVIYDITASVEKRPPDYVTIEKIANKCFVPITVGGGVTSFEIAALCIQSGAEKISFNSVAPQNPQLLQEVASHFGNQAVVLSLDVARDVSLPSGYRLFVQGGRTPTQWDVGAWLLHALPFGVGEVCVNSIDEDGKKQGYDLNLLKLVRGLASVPIVLSGGAGKVTHMVEAFQKGADAALTASILHLGMGTISDLKKSLSEQGIPVRLN
jgi:imidazole glycerol-phosphate synthase subunit HisF